MTSTGCSVDQLGRALPDDGRDAVCVAFVAGHAFEQRGVKLVAAPAHGRLVAPAPPRPTHWSSAGRFARVACDDDEEEDCE